MGILKYFRNQFKINSSINTVEKNNVVYTAYYKDMGNEYSDVKCIIKTLYNNQEHSFDLGAKIPNKLIKNDKPVILPVSDEGKDGVAFVFPERQSSEKKEYSTLLLSNYQIDIGVNSIKTTHLNKKVLSNNAKFPHFSNKYHSYSKPRATELSNGDIIIAAVDSNSDSEGQYVTAWLLEKEQEFEVNEGSKGSTNRLLFKIDENVENDFQFLSANQNNNVGKIIYSNSASLFSLDVTKSMVDDIKGGKYVNNKDDECLFAVGKEHCDQFDNRVSTPFLTSEEISNLSAINTENEVVIAFLENGQRLCLAKLAGKKGEKPKKHIIHNYEEPIKSLQLSMTNKGSVMISAVGEKNITQNTVNAENLKVVAVRDFPTDAVRTLDDFVNIIYNNPLKLTTSFPYATFSTPKISSEGTVTSPLSITNTEEVTTRGSTITTKEDTTSAATTEVTAQRTITEQKTTGYTTVVTTASATQPTTTAPPKTTTSTETTTLTTQPTTSSKITTSTEKTTVRSTNQATKTSTIKAMPFTTKPTAKSTIRSTSRYTKSTRQDSTTTIIQGITVAESTTANVTTLASTVGSVVVTTLGLVTQNATSMLTNDSNPTVKDSSFNQTDVSSNYEERSLNTAEISAAIVISIAVMIGMSCVIYKKRRRSNIRPPSDHTDDVECCQRLRSHFGSYFNRSRETVPELQLEPLDNNVIQVDSNEEEITVYQKDKSNSNDNLLSNQGQSSYGGTSNNAFTAEKDKISISETKVSNGVEQSSKIEINDSAV